MLARIGYLTLGTLVLVALFAPIPFSVDGSQTPDEWVEREAMGSIRKFADMAQSNYAKNGQSLGAELSWSDLYKYEREKPLELSAAHAECFGVHVESTQPPVVMFLFNSRATNQEINGRHFGRDICLRCNVATGEQMIEYALPQVPSRAWHAEELFNHSWFEFRDHAERYIEREKENKQVFRNRALGLLAVVAGLLTVGLLLNRWDQRRKRVPDAEGKLVPMPEGDDEE